MPVTLKDIASKVGLSIPTVSEVLRNDPGSRLALDTRQRVRRAASELGYSYNAYARALSTGRSRVVGMLMESLTLEIALSRLQAVYDMVSGREYSPEMRNTRGIGEDEARLLREFAGRMAEGVIALQGLMRSSHDSVSFLIGQGIPVVSLEPVIGLDIDCISVDRSYGGYIATKHLIANGHVRIALLHGKPPNRLIQGRIHGYMRALDEEGIPIDEKLMVRCTGAGFPADGYDAMKILLSRKAGHTAVFCNNDQLAFGAMRALLDDGLRVPEDVAVVGFDNNSLSAYAPIPLTSVQQPVDEMARLATDLLFQRIEGAGGAVQKQVIAVKPTLIVRQSSVAK